jgi:outer membrane murein-binding lipoprotein Lpp
MAMKNVVGALALIGLGLAGCDQSKAELDSTKQQLQAVTAERDSLKTQLDSTKQQLAAAQQQMEQMKQAQAAPPAAPPSGAAVTPPAKHSSGGKAPAPKAPTAKQIDQQEQKKANTGGSSM